MRKGLIYSVLCCLLLLSCKEEEKAVYPENLIPQDAFTRVLTEFYLIEAIHSHKVITDHDFQKNTYSFYKEVLQKEGITLEEFREALNWHTSYPREFQLVYEDVLEELTRRSDQNDN